MQLDLQHLTVKLEQLLSLKPVPHTGYVEGYIKAFYLPESGLEQWISQHTVGGGQRARLTPRSGIYLEADDLPSERGQPRLQEGQNSHNQRSLRLVISFSLSPGSLYL